MSMEEYSSSDFNKLCMQRSDVVSLIPGVSPDVVLGVFNDLFACHFGILKVADGSAPSQPLMKIGMGHLMTVAFLGNT